MHCSNTQYILIVCQSLQTFLSTPSRTRSRIAGTAVIRVGDSTVASPFVPFFILFDVSVRVKGDPYPIALPTAAITFFNMNVKDNSGKIAYGKKLS